MIQVLYNADVICILIELRRSSTSFFLALRRRLRDLNVVPRLRTNRRDRLIKREALVRYLLRFGQFSMPAGGHLLLRNGFKRYSIFEFQAEV